MSARRLRFPDERSLGRLSRRLADASRQTEWQALGEAQGIIAVPPDCEIRLDLGAGVQDLTPLVDLEPDDLHTLDGAAAQVADHELIWLRQLTGLRVLILSGAAITNAGVAHLAGLIGLVELDLSRTQIDGRALAHLAAIPGLRRLDLRGATVTDYGLALLAPHPEAVAFDQTRFSSDADEAFQPLRYRYEMVAVMKRNAVVDEEVAAFRAEWTMAQRDPRLLRQRLFALAWEELAREIRDSDPFSASHATPVVGPPPDIPQARPLPELITEVFGGPVRVADIPALGASDDYYERQTANRAASYLAEHYPLEAFPLLVQFAVTDRWDEGFALRGAFPKLAAQHLDAARAIFRHGLILEPGQAPILLHEHPSERIRWIVAVEIKPFAVAAPEIGLPILEVLAADPEERVAEGARSSMTQVVVTHGRSLTYTGSLTPLQTAGDLPFVLLQRYVPLATALAVARILNALEQREAEAATALCLTLSDEEAEPSAREAAAVALWRLAHRQPQLRPLLVLLQQTGARGFEADLLGKALGNGSQ